METIFKAALVYLFFITVSTHAFSLLTIPIVSSYFDFIDLKQWDPNRSKAKGGGQCVEAIQNKK